MANAYYATQTQRTLNDGELPTLSHSLESFRAYQWEVEIELPTGFPGPETLTLAAKKVSQISFTSEDIVADRVNDKFYYPGKVTPEVVTITFDNLVKGGVAETLYDYMSNTYDPVNGVFTPQFMSGNGSFKSHIKIFQLDNAMFPVKHINLYGAYPKSWKLADFNYSTNEFHTLEVEIRYDFAVQYSGLD
jgi:hypothetical protein|tara:strand:- start:680 stop:1249 length:570 start_codon:yes stop_codon:yes gene_type:complete